MPRTRTTKTLAQRIDLNYFKRPTPLKRARLWLSILAPALALAWILFHAFSHDPRVYSSGRLSEPHAILEKECSACHEESPAEFSAKPNMFGCLACHDGPQHHSVSDRQLDCALCHAEHRGRINLSATSNQSCAQCHSDLGSHHPKSNYANRIHDFEKGHPEFAALRTEPNQPAKDATSIRLNHQLHLRPIREGPGGPTVTLNCENCHRPPGVATYWQFSHARYQSATVGYKEADVLLPIPSGLLPPPKPATGRELMAPVKFANACSACHSLAFDPRFNEGVPHDTPQVVHAFVVRKFTEYIASHPFELHEVQVPNRMLAGTAAPRAQTLTPSQWIAEHTLVAEQLLWRKTCSQCHVISGTPLQDSRLGRWDASGSRASIPSTSFTSLTSSTSSPSSPSFTSSSLPSIAAANITQRWLPHSRFDHDAHRGFSCVSCHQKALTSTDSSDILIPGIAVCRTCHAPGPDHAESRCFECHTYHDWSKRQEVKPTFTPHALRTGSIHVEISDAPAR